MTVEDLLPTKYRDKAAEYEKGTDTMDVWFDSGTIFWCQIVFPQMHGFMSSLSTSFSTFVFRDCST